MLTSNTKHLNLFEASIPSRTSSAIFEMTYNILHYITVEHVQYSKSQNLVTTPISMVSLLSKCVITHILPSNTIWREINSTGYKNKSVVIYDQKIPH